MSPIPEKINKLVSQLTKQGKDEKFAFAICTASLEKSDKLEEILDKIDSEKGKEKDLWLQELETYIQNNSLDDKESPAKTKNNKEPFHRFTSSVPFSLSDENSDKTIDIQCLKAGKFRHPWYGVLNFDDKFFNSAIRNFEVDIPNPEIAFDFKHQPDYGAAAWINKLFVEDNSLMANVTLTERGRQSIKSKEFRYFSVEYTEDYSEYEFIEKKNDNGVLVEEERKISFGPTVLGGGLTNRPFIKGMAPVSLSETGEIIELEEIIEKVPQTKKEVTAQMEKTLEELKAAQEEIKAKMVELEESNAKGKKKAEEKDSLEAKLSEISENIKVLSEKKPEEKKGDSDTKSLEEAAKKLQEKDQEVMKLSDDVKTLSETVTKLMESNKVLQEDKHQISVEKKLEDLKKLGVFPATLKKIEEIAFSEAVKGFNVTLSEDGKDVSKTFFEVVESVFESIPKEYRFTDGETSESVITPTGKSKELSIEDVEAYAKEKGIVFSEALIELSKEGKIE